MLSSIMATPDHTYIWLLETKSLHSIETHCTTLPMLQTFICPTPICFFLTKIPSPKIIDFLTDIKNHIDKYFASKSLMFWSALWGIRRDQRRLLNRMAYIYFNKSSTFSNVSMVIFWSKTKETFRTTAISYTQYFCFLFCTDFKVKLIYNPLTYCAFYSTLNVCHKII